MLGIRVVVLRLIPVEIKFNRGDHNQTRRFHPLTCNMGESVLILIMIAVDPPMVVCRFHLSSSMIYSKRVDGGYTVVDNVGEMAAEKVKNILNERNR